MTSQATFTTCRWCHNKPHLPECDLEQLHSQLDMHTMRIANLEVELGTARRKKMDIESRMFALLREDFKPKTQLMVRAMEKARSRPEDAAKKRWERVLEKILGT